jgi:hypothetical protein
MKSSFPSLSGALALFLLVATSALSQTVPVSENLWRLVAQEDTDGDRKITILDHITSFVILARVEDPAGFSTPIRAWWTAVSAGDIGHGG